MQQPDLLTLMLQANMWGASRLLVTSAGRVIAKPQSMPKRSARLASANGGQAGPHEAPAQAGMPSKATTQPQHAASLRSQDTSLSAAAGKPCMAVHLRHSAALHRPSAPSTPLEVVQQPAQSRSECSAGPLAADPASPTMLMHLRHSAALHSPSAPSTPLEVVQQPAQSRSERSAGPLAADPGSSTMIVQLRHSAALHRPSAPSAKMKVMQQLAESCSERSAGPSAADPASSTKCYVGPGHGRVCAWCGLTGGQALCPHDAPLQCDRQPLRGWDSSANRGQCADWGWLHCNPLFIALLCRNCHCSSKEISKMGSSFCCLVPVKPAKLKVVSHKVLCDLMGYCAANLEEECSTAHPVYWPACRYTNVAPWPDAPQ